MEVRDSRFHEDVKDLTDVLHGTLHGTGILPKAAGRRWFIPAVVLGLAVLTCIFWLQFAHHWDVKRAGSQTAGGASDPSKPAANVAGEWQATVKYDWGDTYNELFAFEVDGQELSGTAGFLGARKENGRPIWDGKIQGDKISFMTKSLTTISGDEKTYEDKHYYKGTVKERHDRVHHGHRQQRGVAFTYSLHRNPGEAQWLDAIRRSPENV